MTQFAIGKRSYDGESATYVTAILKGGLSIDNKRIWNDRFPFESWGVRKWATSARAEKALEKLVTVGGFDDYSIISLGGEQTA